MIRRTALIAAAALLVGLPAALRAQTTDPPQTEEQKRAEGRLLELGKVAPDFTLPMLGGGEVTLANLQKGGKAVLVVFWGMEPRSGGEAMPKLQKVHEKLESKGLMTVTINPEDDVRDVKDFVESSKLHYTVAIDGKETNRAVTGVYKARMLPTYYLLDPDGKVLWRSVGYREAALVEAVAKAGIK
jgi:peroxiredoxin